MKVARRKCLFAAVAGMALLPAANCTATTILGDFYSSAMGQTAASVSAFTTAGIPNLTGANTVDGFELSHGGTVGENTGNPFPITTGGITVSGGDRYFAHQIGTNGNSNGTVYQAGPFNSNTFTTTISGLNALLPAGVPTNIYLFTSDIFTNAPNTISMVYAGTTYGPTTLSTQGFAEFTVTSGTDSFTVRDAPGSGASYADFTAFAIETPEPASLALLGLGFLGLLCRRRNKPARDSNAELNAIDTTAVQSP